ncbi:MAG: 3-dehydroquinate synthase [Gammaproteobacteria bacterium]|nr:3-dehydroquinate synthase [Gammaproteobacteria bacterium]
MITVNVALSARAYPILIGPGLLDDAALVAAHIPGRQVALVTNETVAPLYLERLEKALAGRQLVRIVLPDGEQYKTLESFNAIVSRMLEARLERGCTLVALGGGVVGDVAGFAAACYQRGVRFVQIPTTLLAQVDSSVGGKTAVNHALGKNMIGAFHQPSAVIADIATLNTLPDRELRAGLAEVIKYGLIQDLDFLIWLEANLDALLARDPAALAEAVRRSCEHKAVVVAADERESGLRALLNLGHTFGHAIEHALGYGQWLHGEAVAAGMCLAAEMSARLGRISRADADRVTRLLARADLPVSPPPEIAPATLLEAMSLDKKNKDGRIRLVLFEALGRAALCDDYPQDALLATLAEGSRAVARAIA